MKLVCISDTHNFLDRIDVPAGDVLIHAGDATLQGGPFEFEKFAQDLAELPHKYKIYVPGNHDFLMEENPGYCRSILYGAVPDLFILDEAETTIEGYNFYGSPVNSNIRGWAFWHTRGEARTAYNKIPKCDVLITHEPPKGILDEVIRKKPHEPDRFVGSLSLQTNVLNRIRPKVHIFGHIHESYGQVSVQGVKFINAAILNEKYKITNDPIVYELGEENV